MYNFVKYLQKAKDSVTNMGCVHNIHLVLGNESCDLDSTVSTLVLGYWLHLNKTAADTLILPIMNVAAQYFPLRTETCYLLSKIGIDWQNLLVFKDQIDLNSIIGFVKKTQTSLVDHHVLPASDQDLLGATVVQIFDHRPIAPDFCYNDPAKVRAKIKRVGSCATLIADEILGSKQPLFRELYYLLYATIIFDTIGLQVSQGKTTDDDIRIASNLEAILKLDADNQRKSLFEQLWLVHIDSSGIPTKQLLFRDLKVVENVPIPALPMLVEDYLKRDDALTAISSFADDYKSTVVLLVGIDASGDVVKRDLAIFYKNLRFLDVLEEHFRNSKSMAGDDLDLEVVRSGENIKCFRQNNVKLTRKFIIPLVNKAVLYYNANK